MKPHNPFYVSMLLLLSAVLVSVFAQQPPRTLSTVDAELSKICGESEERASYSERLQLIHRLPSNLAQEQLERCREFLESPLAGQSLPDLELNGLKNDMVLALLRQKEGLAELAELLSRMSRAPETDATWRDYCVQFLGKCYPAIADRDSREAMGGALWEALGTRRASRGAVTATVRVDALKHDGQQASDLHRSLAGEYTVAAAVPETLSYDADGNMLSNDGWTYAWNAQDRLVSAAKGTTRLEFAYDYMGRRFEKKVYENNVLTKRSLYAYDGFKQIAEYDALDNNALLNTYIWQPAGLDVPLLRNGSEFYVSDANKNVVALMDTTGAVTDTYVYDPFGNCAHAGDSSNPFRFSSEYHDDETDLVYYNYRYYSPELGRWTKRDPIGEEGGINPYGILNNSILNFYDLQGLSWKIERKNSSWGNAHRTSSNDSLAYLSALIGLAHSEITHWLKNTDLSPVSKKDLSNKCHFKFPNEFVIYVAKAKLASPFLAQWSIKLTLALENKGLKVSNYREDIGITSNALVNAIRAESTWGYALFGHGNKQIRSWIDWSPDEDFSNLNGGFAFDSEEVLNPGLIKKKYRYGLGINYHCFAALNSWRELSLIYYGGGSGMISALAGPRAIGYYGSWESLVKEAVP